MDPLRRESACDAVLTAVAALVKRLHIRQGEVHSQLSRVSSLRDERRGNAVLVQVDVADAVKLHDAAVKVNGLPRRENGLRGQQRESGFKQSP